ncbi:thioredoxin-domain-containing protein [Boletus coccyginus]|nr:thioredoxin-domain-containing protein [Boletus coccyginus]
MSVTHVKSVSHLNGVLSDSNKLTVIDFHATWCGPCHVIAPTFEALANQYPSVNFIKCDVDAARDVASTYRVSVMPTFIFLQGSKQIHMIRGADKTGLQDAVKRFASPSSGTGAFPGQGHTLGGSPSPANDGPTATESDRSTSVWSGLIHRLRSFWAP